MGEVVDLVPKTPRARRPVDSNIATWGLGVQRDGSLILTIIDADRGPTSFFLDHSLVDNFENAVSVAAQHSRDLARG